jgi:hypothetical protein
MVFVASHGFTQTMIQATIKSIDTLEITSASGLERLNDHWLVVGDDAPDVHVLDSNFNLVNKVQITSRKDLKGNRLKKSEKPDYEAMVILPWGNDKDALIFGSGNSSKRRKLVRIDFDKGYDFSTEGYSLKKFYKHLRKEADLSKDELNIEGAAIWDKKLILLNRFNNQVYILKVDEFKEYIKDSDNDKPEISIHQFDTPTLDGNPSGFSGAEVIEELGILVFTASVEQKPYWVNPDEIIGSYIGILDLNELDNKSPVHAPIMYQSNMFSGKVEAIICVGHDENHLNLICVTDNDDGQSLLLEIELSRSSQQ